MSTPPSLASSTRAVVLVEGASDEAAVRTLAGRRGRDLAAEGVDVVAMGGITNIGRHLRTYRTDGVVMAGLYDEGEAHVVRRALARAGLAEHRFHVCTLDLEDEHIRALGADAVLAILDQEGELATFRTMQRQPAQRDRPLDAQLRRFLGTRSGRKIRYGALLVDAAADAGVVPAPLDAVLASVR